MSSPVHPSDTVLAFQAMGSACKVRIAGWAAADAEATAAQAVAEVRRIEAKYSRYQPGSIVSRINAQAGSGRPVALDDAETLDLLRFADQLHQASQGLFDITSGVLRRAWDFRRATPPDPRDVEALLPLIGWQDVAWNAQEIALPRPGMELDFGGFGKEYAADRAATLLQSLGVRHGIVNLGGDLRVIGPRPDDRPWDIAIAHPRQAQATAASVAIAQGALATSGDYERYLEFNGQRHCHILNPFTGWPVRHWQGISVLAPACLAAGALATIAMLKEAEAPAFLATQGVAYLLIDQAGQLTRHT